MRYIPLFILLVLTACQSDKQPSAEATSTAPSKTVSAVAEKPNLEGDKLCFNRTSDQGGMSLEIVVNEDKTVEGFLSIDSKSEKISGSVKGRYYTDEYVLDFNYTVDGKSCMEKLLLNYTNRDATVARSGTIIVDGDRHDRNGGMGTMDLIPSVDCK